ncbi:MAG: hypothetical protein C0514_08315 [Candidatus Puniceispirillum sp.]|nr:hypothetical protein [Candidatus Puniceispirillum sp.]
MHRIVKFLSRFSIEKKLKFLGYSSMILYAGILCLDLYLDRTTLYNARHKNLISLSAQAVTILDFYHQRVLDGEIGLEEAQSKAKRILDSIYHCPANGYFILDLTPKGGRQFELIGRTNNALKKEDIPKVAALLKESQKKDRPVQGYIDREGKYERKIFYASYFAPWGWLVGTGDWVSDLEEHFEALAFKKLTFLFPLIYAVIFLLFGITQSIIIPLDNITRSLKRLAGRKKIPGVEASNTEVNNITLLIENIDQLQKELDLRFKQIVSLNKRLTKQNAELLDFAFVMSHDLQTPLRKIQLLVSRFQYQHDDVEGPRRDMLEQVKELVVFAKTLIEDILTFSQLSSHALKLKATPLQECVYEALKMNDIYFENVAHTIKISHLPTLKVDRVLMIQVFSNLISNAVKYRHPDRPLLLTIETKLEKETSVVVISDNGHGLEGTSAKHIFKPFRRGHHHVPGKGLGLAICKKIVEKHNGSIWAEPNKNGQGLSIKFTIKEK